MGKLEAGGFSQRKGLYEFFIIENGLLVCVTICLK